MEQEKNTNQVTQQQTQQQQSTVSPTIDVYGSKINRSDFINYINENANSFFSTYNDMWSNKQKQQLLQQKDALINNIANGNITRIGNNSMDITNIDNSGIDSTQGGAGQIIVGMADKVAQEVHNQLEAAKPHKKWTDSTLQQSWLNYFYGGKDPGNYQSWVDRDAKNDKGKRAITNRIAAIRQWLNTINPADYTSGLDSFGGQEEFANRLNALKQSLADGTIDNNDYTAADRLGFGSDLRTLLSDDIVSQEDTDANTNGETSYDGTTKPTTDEEIIANAWNGGNPQDIYKQVANTIRNWKAKEYSTRIAKASYNSATNYLSYRNKNDRSGSYNIHDPNSQQAYYSTKFFPEFFKKFKDEQFSPEYINNHNNPISTWRGQQRIWQYIADNLTLAIRNRIYGNSTLLGQYADQLNPVLGLDGKPTGFWTIPESFNEANGTEFIYNPDTGEYKRISLSDPKYKYLMQSYLLGKGINLQQTQDQSQDQSQTYKEGGKIDKLQYGGEFIQGAFNNPQITSIAQLGVQGAPTAQQLAQQRKLQQQQAQQQAQQKIQQQKDKFWKGNEGKEIHSPSDFFNSLTLQDQRELKAAAADLGSIAANIAGAATAAPTAGVGALVGGATSAGLGLYAAYKRAQNRYNDDGKFDLGDIGATALDSGMALAGLIPGIGAAAKTGSLVAKFGKVAHIVMAGLGGLGLLESYPGAKRAAENIIAGKMPSTADLQSFTSALTMLTGATSYKGAHHVQRTIQKNAAANGRVIQSAATPESWTYKFQVKGKPQQITLANKQQVNNLKSAIKNEKADEILNIIKNNDSKFQNTKVEDLSFTKMSKLEGLKAKTTDNIAGITHNKAVQGGTTFSKYQKGEDYTTYDGKKKINPFEQKLWNTSVGLGNKINSLNPHWNNLNWKQKIFGRTNDDVFEQYTPKSQTNSTSSIEGVQPKPTSTVDNSTSAPPTNNSTEGSTSTPQAPTNGSTEGSTSTPQAPTNGSTEGSTSTPQAPTNGSTGTSQQFSQSTLNKIQDIFDADNKTINIDKLDAFRTKYKNLINDRLSSKDKNTLDLLIRGKYKNSEGKNIISNEEVFSILAKALTKEASKTHKPSKAAIDATKAALASIKFEQGGILYAQNGVQLPWYSTLQYYDPTKYTTQYSNTLYGINANNQYTGNLVYGNAGNGLGTSRYKPDSRYSDFTITGQNNTKKHIKDLIQDNAINKNDPNIDAIKATKEALADIKFKQGGILYAQNGTTTYNAQVFGKYGKNRTYGGITNNNNNTTWYNNVFIPYSQHILDQLKAYNSNDTYGNWLNNMQTDHYKIYTGAGGTNWNPQIAYNDEAEAVKNYQTVYNEDPYSNDKVTYGYNTRGITPAYNAGRYKEIGYAKRNGQDSLNTAYTPDGSYGGRTDDRRILGREGDFTDQQLADWNTKLKALGWEQYLDPTTKYYKLRRLQQPQQNSQTEQSSKVDGTDPTTMQKSHILTDVLNGLKNHLPDIAEAARVGWNNRFNNRQRDYQLQHMNPVLLQPYSFYRKIYGDYGTMSEYNRQGSNTQNVANTIASNTADSSLAAATQLQGASQANDLAIKGKLADNQMIRDTYEKALAQNKENLQIANSVANTNRKNLNDNDRERAQVVLATNTMNHQNWDKFWQVQDLKAQHAQDERNAMQKYLDYATIINNNSRMWDSKVKEITNRYRQQYLDATTDEEKQVIANKMQEELTSLGYQKQDSLLNALAQLRGLKYSYTPVWKAKVTIPVTATPTYAAKGGTLNVTKLATTAVKKKNKDIERMYKDWSKKDNRFFNQLGKLRQARFDKIIRIK